MENRSSIDQVLDEVRALRREVELLNNRMKAVPEHLSSHASLIVSLLESEALPPVSGWSLDVRVLAEIIRISSDLPNDSRIIELGSGISTFWLAKLFGHRGFRITSYEHDELYYRRTQDFLVRSKLQDSVELVFAPLTKESQPWYSLTHDDSLVNLLLVDGPPGQSAYAARLPALSVFARKIAPNGYVVIDDAVRENDRRAYDAWLDWEDAGASFVQTNFVAGAAILQLRRTEDSK